MATYYLKNLTTSSILVNDLGIDIPSNGEIPIDSNSINGWLTGDLRTEIQSSNLILSTTDISDNSGDMSPIEAIKALTITSEYDTDNPHDVTFTQAVTADPNTDVTTSEIETLTNGSDAAGLHNHDGRYYTITQVSQSNPTTVDIHWDNIIDAPSFGSFEWRAPAIARIIGQEASPPPGNEGEFYLDTTDAHLYRHDGTTWVDQGVPAAEDRVIDKTNENIYEYDGTQWQETIPVDGWSLLIQDDGDGNPAQYIYTDISGTLKWTKIADIDWGTHNQIGGRSDAAAHPGLAITYNNTLTSWNLINATIQEALDEVNDLISIAGKEVYVDNTRIDNYVETGAEDKPFKTIAAAIADLGNSGTIHIGPGTYTEDFTAPGNFAIKGAGAGNTILEGDFMIGDGTPRGRAALEDLFLKGEMTVDLSDGFGANVTRCNSEGSVVVSSGGVNADYFSVTPTTSGVTAVTVSGNGFFTNENAVLTSTGDVPTIASTGTVTLDTCEISGTTTGPVLSSTGGIVRTSFSSVTNSGTGTSAVLNNTATPSNPNSFQGLSHNAGIELNASVTVVEGVYGGIPTGTNIIFRPGTQIGYDNTNSALLAEDVQAAIDELDLRLDSAEYGFSQVLYVDKGRTDSYTPNGSISYPYKTITDAMAAAGPGYVVKVSGGTYTEDFTVPDKVSLVGAGMSKTILKGTAITIGEGGPGSSVEIKGLSIRTPITVDSGDGVVDFDDSYISTEGYLNIVTGDVRNASASTTVVDTPAVTMGVNASMFSGDNLYITATGDTAAIQMEGGILALNDSYVQSDGTTNPTIDSNDGQVSITHANVLNLGGGTAIDVANGATAAAANALRSIVHIGGIQTGAAVTYAENINGGDPVGSAIIYSPATQTSFDSSNNGLTSENVQSAIEEILGKKVKGIIFVGRNGNDGLGDPTLGSYLSPYATIQAAINRIEENNDGATNPYVIWVAPGIYPENVLVNDTTFNNITIIGHGEVKVSPAFGKAFESNNQNANFSTLEFRNIIFDAALNFVGESDGGTTFNGELGFYKCQFNSAATGNFNNVINIRFEDCLIDTSLDFTNVENIDLINSNYIGSQLLDLVTDTNVPKPAAFSETSLMIDNSKLFNEIICDAGSEVLTTKGSVLGDGTSQINIYGTLTSINSWLKPSLLVINNTATFTTQGTFFDKSVLQLNGVFTNETKADVVYYDDSITQLVADNVQDAIDNLNGKIDAFLVPHGTTFPSNPDGPALFYRTDYSILFQYHEDTTKWLSTTQMFLDWGANNADGKYLNIHGAVATQTGYLMPYDGTIVSVTAKIASGNQDKGFEIRRNHDMTTPLATFSATAGSYNDVTLNIDFSAGDYIQAFATSTGVPARDVVIMATINWRAN